MVQKIYYVIEAQTGLIDVFNQSPDLNALFSKPIIWMLEEGGYGGPIPTQRVVGVKLLYLAYFRSNLRNRGIQNHQKILDYLMGQPPYHVDIFDQWWTLKRIPGVNELPVVLKHILPEELNFLADSGMPLVDKWIDGLKNLSE